MTDPETNSGFERDLPTFEEACRKSPASDLIRLVLAIAGIVHRMKERRSLAPPRVGDARPIEL